MVISLSFPSLQAAIQGGRPTYRTKQVERRRDILVTAKIFISSVSLEVSFLSLTTEISNPCALSSKCSSSQQKRNNCCWVWLQMQPRYVTDNKEYNGSCGSKFLEAPTAKCLFFLKLTLPMFVVSQCIGLSNDRLVVCSNTATFFYVS